jgi:4-carboxymuconolactone decarboxylase
LRRDDNLKGHLHSGLDVGLSPEQIVEIMLQLIFYTGAPIANTALNLANEVFKERGLKVDPIRAYDTSEDPEVLYQRGLAKRREVMGDDFRGDFQPGDELDQDWERYTLEYLWGSVWTRPGLDLQSRCICTLTALTLVGTEQSIRNYTRAALNVGLTDAQIKELFFHLNFYIGQSLSRRALSIAREVFNSR